MKSYKRSVEVHVGGQIFESKKLYIEFDVPFDDDTTPNESDIRIYNLSDSSVNQIKKNQKVVLNAGYEGDVGVLLAGRVSTVNTTNDGPDKVTTINVLDGTDLSGVKTEHKAYSKNVKASTILKALIPKLGVEIGAFRLPRDKVYAEGYSVTGGIEDNLADIAKDCGASFYINKGKLYVRALSDGDDARFILSPSTGLIGSPEYFSDDETENGYNVRCLLQYRITTGAILQIDSRYVKGKYRARRGRHTCSMDEFITEVEVVG